MEMALEAIPRPGRVAGQRLMSPKIRRRWRRSCGTLSGNLPIDLGFFVRRLLIGRGASLEVDQGALTTGGRGPGAGRAPWWWGRPVAPLCLLFGLLKASVSIWMFGYCFVQFREYFLCSFSETQKQQKIGNWHCGIFSIG
jgi:hypothetical protein